MSLWFLQTVTYIYNIRSHYLCRLCV